jgi:hypothetical protein
VPLHLLTAVPFMARWVTGRKKIIKGMCERNEVACDRVSVTPLLEGGAGETTPPINLSSGKPLYDLHAAGLQKTRSWRI